MSGRRPLPGAPGVTFDYWIGGSDRVFVRYNGSIEALVGNGVATPAMLAQRPTRWPRRLDGAGLPFSLRRYFGSKDGRPMSKACLTWRISREQALLLPGIAYAVADGLHEEAEERVRLQLRVWDTMAAGMQTLREVPPPSEAPLRSVVH